MQSIEVPCAFCQGLGKDPFGIMSWLSSCCVCGGRGRVRLPSPWRTCRHCRGTGAVKTFVCTVCFGKGALAAPRGQSRTCPTCRGWGDDPSAPAMACLTCRGRGWLEGSPPGQGAEAGFSFPRVEA